MDALVERRRPVREGHKPTDMNVQEKSDCAVVPVNQPNNEGLLSAEVGEGRAQTEENIVQSYMCPTQSGETHVPEIARCVASSKIRFAAMHPQ